MKIAILGLGEAGSHFANDLVKMGINVSGWDPDLRKTLDPNISFAADNTAAIKDANIIFSVNYASEAKSVAQEVLPHLKQDQVYCEMNTASPATKKQVAKILEPAGIHFVDVAIMAPVPSKGINVPFLASGEGAPLLANLLAPYHLSLTILKAGTGEAARRKLLRSIVYKGVAAVICEAVEAGQKLQLEGYIRSEITSILAIDNQLVDRFIEGSQEHAKRRFQEMQEVVAMLECEGLSSHMSQGAMHNLERYVN